MHCRATEATRDAQGSLHNLEDELQKPANWQPHQQEGVWSKVKKTVTGTPPSAADRTQQTAKEALTASQKAADEAVARAKQVGQALPLHSLQSLGSTKAKCDFSSCM